MEPSTTVVVNGVACAGLLYDERETGRHGLHGQRHGRGFRAIVVLLEMELESVAVSFSSRKDGYS